MRLTEVVLRLVPAGTNLGIEAEHLTLAQHAPLAASSAAHLVETYGLVEQLRQVKDAAELDALRRAAAIGAEVFKQLIALLSPGVSEAEMATEIEYRARLLGAAATSFKPIIASGPRSALPHAGFTTSRLQPGVPTVIDLGVVVDGYCSDMTRTVFLGDCPGPWLELYALVDQARASAQAALRPGLSGRDADAAARTIIAKAGYGQQFGHGLGHGVGIQIHENPRLTNAVEQELVSGNVVTCEPGIYLPGAGGIRIENLCAITAVGSENLTPLGTELLVL
jgi:Xaa-Pro aminopeptidase